MSNGNRNLLTVRVSSGEIRLNGGSSSSSSSAVFDIQSALTVSAGTHTLEQASKIQGTGTLTVMGTANVTINGYLNITGATFIKGNDVFFCCFSLS